MFLTRGASLAISVKYRSIIKKKNVITVSHQPRLLFDYPSTINHFSSLQQYPFFFPVLFPSPYHLISIFLSTNLITYRPSNFLIPSAVTYNFSTSSATRLHLLILQLRHSPPILSTTSSGPPQILSSIFSNCPTLQ